MLTFDHQGLVPAVIQDAASGEVLMVAFMNEEAFRLTRATGQTHFYSRSRNTIWHKGEQSGNVQDVRDIFINCEENSLLIRVDQHGGAACHDGYKSCYYRRLQADEGYEIVAERVFDPEVVYASSKEPAVSAESAQQSFPIAKDSLTTETEQKLEAELRQLYGVYLYLRDHDLSEESNTSRLLQERSQGYLVSRLADELQELADVQTGEHVHSGRQLDTMLEGSQVGYWLFLIAAGMNVPYNDFAPHASLLDGYCGQYSDARAIEQRQECLSLVSDEQAEMVAQGLRFGFAQIGWASAAAGISPLEPAEYDLSQMRRKGLVK
jgi:phosphoribosyl-AMP cyclohydrolase